MEKAKLRENEDDINTKTANHSAGALCAPFGRRKGRGEANLKPGVLLRRRRVHQHHGKLCAKIGVEITNNG